MNIAVIGTLPDTKATAYTGPERTTIGLGEALAAKGHDVTVIADEGSPETIDTNTRILTPDLSPGIRRMFTFNYRISRSICLDQFDIIHAWRPVFRCDILSLHSVGMAEEVEAGFPGTFSRRFVLGAKLHRLAKMLTAKHADQVVMTAPGNLEYAAKYGVPADTMIPVGVDNKFLQEDEYDELDVLTVSRIERRKQPTFVDQNTPDRYKTRIVGGASNKSLASELSDRWVGRVPEVELRRYYRKAGVFVLPSYFEGFGLTAAEAMAAATPVVVSDESCIDEWVDEFDLGAVYTWGSNDSYRRALDTVFQNRDEYGRNARAFVDAHLTWERIASYYEKLYEATVTGDTKKLELWRNGSFLDISQAQV